MTWPAIAGANLQFSVARISVTGGGTLNDPDGVMTFIVPAKAVERDLCMLFLPDQDADTTLRLSKRNNILSATNQPVAPEVISLRPFQPFPPICGFYLM
jgi:hypothetical protein